MNTIQFYVYRSESQEKASGERAKNEILPRGKQQIRKSVCESQPNL